MEDKELAEMRKKVQNALARARAQEIKNMRREVSSWDIRDMPSEQIMELVENLKALTSLFKTRVDEEMRRREKYARTS